jgi:hypothetical protein
VAAAELLVDPLEAVQPELDDGELVLVALGVDDRDRQAVAEAPRAREARERVLVGERVDLPLEPRGGRALGGERFRASRSPSRSSRTSSSAGPRGALGLELAAGSGSGRASPRGGLRGSDFGGSDIRRSDLRACLFGGGRDLGGRDLGRRRDWGFREWGLRAGNLGGGGFGRRCSCSDRCIGGRAFGRLVLHGGSRRRVRGQSADTSASDRAAASRRRGCLGARLSEQ